MLYRWPVYKTKGGTAHSSEKADSVVSLGSWRVLYPVPMGRHCLRHPAGRSSDRPLKNRHCKGEIFWRGSEAIASVMFGRPKKTDNVNECKRGKTVWKRDPQPVKSPAAGLICQLSGTVVRTRNVPPEPEIWGNSVVTWDWSRTSVCRPLFVYIRCGFSGYTWQSQSPCLWRWCQAGWDTCCTMTCQLGGTLWQWLRNCYPDYHFVMKSACRVVQKTAEKGIHLVIVVPGAYEQIFKDVFDVIINLSIAHFSVSPERFTFHRPSLRPPSRVSIPCCLSFLIW